MIARDLLTSLASQQAQHSTKVYSLYCYTLTTKCENINVCKLEIGTLLYVMKH